MRACACAAAALTLRVAASWQGEIRIELTQLRLNKEGVKKLAALQPDPSSLMGDMSAALGLPSFGSLKGINPMADLNPEVLGSTEPRPRRAQRCTDERGASVAYPWRAPTSEVLPWRAGYRWRVLWQMALVLVKLHLPGDETLVSQPVRVSKSAANPKPCRFALATNSFHDTSDRSRLEGARTPPVCARLLLGRGAGS